MPYLPWAREPLLRTLRRGAGKRAASTTTAEHVFTLSWDFETQNGKLLAIFQEALGAIREPRLFKTE